MPGDGCASTTKSGGLLAAADQCQVPRLVALCERELCATIAVETAARLLVLSDRHHAVQLKEHCLDFTSR